jgi:hypothetical protein
MKGKGMKTLIAIMAAAVILNGCTKRPTYAPGEEVIYGSHDKTEALTESTGSAGEVFDERLIKSTAELKMQTPSPDTLHREVIKVSQKYNGHVLLSSKSRTTIRVPVLQFNEAVLDIERLGEVTDRRLEGADVTEEYHDLHIRLENALRTRGRYLKLLDQAGDLGEIFRVERELARVNKTIDYLRGKLESMSHQVYYSRISVTTGKKIKKGVIPYVFSQAYKGVSWLFVRN